MNIFEYNDLVLKIKKLELKRNRLELCYDHLKKKKPFFLCKKERNIWKEKVETMEEEIMENMELLFKEYIKYERLLDEYPNIFNQIKSYHIASFLGIAPQALSKLRNTKVY